MTPETNIISVALWTKFPPSFIRDKMIPKLRKHGITVDRILDPGTRSVNLESISCVLIMNEMASHAEVTRIKDLATSYKKKLISISRKESSWTDVIAAVRKA